ncbi:MAG: LysM peptidoglycan-binding domain-containing protein [Gammaproteobacteria bacterium]|nr:LysM peptidoglycan-binding domain-containing protein [Gammaproteobacteria bacterium]MDH5777566.1 LysM peptidoglycan-binding domain-containing protein [Gammaproteobacteria bacterium]
MKIMNNIKIAGLLLTTAVMFGCSGAAQEEPTKEETPQVTKTETPSASSQYQVERGDSLWGISGRSNIYANPYQWPLIYKNNTARIKDADLIYPGQVFDINTDPSASEVSAAINHAKTRGRWSIGVVEDSDKAYLR